MYLDKIRGFEIVTKYKEEGINIPVRATNGSAGYDISAAEDITIPSIWNILSKNQEYKRWKKIQWWKRTKII